MRYDCAVIGAGLAGLTAALRCAEQGMRVLVLAKGLGSLGWGNGCIDLGATPAPAASLELLPADHPLRDQEAVAAAGSWARTRLGLVGSVERSILLPTALGSWVPAALLPATMVAAERNALRQGPILVVGLAEIRDFYAELLADRLREQGFMARATTVRLPQDKRRYDFSNLSVARLLEDAPIRAAFGAQLRAQRQGERTMLLPAVLGAENATKIVAELQALTGCLIGEVATLPTVVAGWRLEQRMLAALRAAGATVQLNAEVARGEWSGARLEAVWTKAAAREQRHVAERYILATGGIGGGGLRADYPGGLVETALGLPVAQPEDRSAWFAESASGPHQVFAAGISADSAQRAPTPIGAWADNLWVAGSALAGPDPVRGRFRAGLALVAGYRAAEQASKHSVTPAPGAS